jgi:hypothetical protein
MRQFTDDDVRTRAFRLWEEAGKPDKKMNEFWYKAERQLQAERGERESKKPEAA